MVIPCLTSYVYGADGARLKKTEGANTTVTFGPVEIRKFGQGAAEEVVTYPHPNVRLVNGAASYMHRDQLASVRAISTAAGLKAKRTTYKPFGEFTDHIHDATEASEAHGFIGQRYDAEAGLQYLNARYYDTALAMFIQPDWFDVTLAGVGTNRYAYCFNDPINCVDPSGNVARHYDSTGDGVNDSVEQISVGSERHEEYNRWQAAHRNQNGAIGRAFRMSGGRVGSFSDHYGFAGDTGGYRDYFGPSGNPLSFSTKNSPLRRGGFVNPNGTARVVIFYNNIRQIQIQRSRVGLGAYEYMVPANFVPSNASISRTRTQLRTLKGLPSNYGSTLARIRSGVRDPHRNDGTTFQNREGRLPSQRNGYYTEYVVRTPNVSGAGRRRIVTGRGGEIYYSGNHYGSFISAPAW